MAVEIASALMLGGLVLWLVLQPLYRPDSLVPAFEEPLDPEETRKGIALIALKELDFDRATGKLSDGDFEFLKERYTQEAVAAIQAEADDQVDPVEAMIASRAQAMRGGAPTAPGLHCPQCGPRPETDALFCSGCGVRLVTADASASACASCAAPVEPGSRFCGSCGGRVAA